MTATHRKQRRSERGQGITEYAAILAFVAGIASMVYLFVPGRLGPAISSSFSSMTGQMDRMNSHR